VLFGRVDDNVAELVDDRPRNEDAQSLDLGGLVVAERLGDEMRTHLTSGGIGSRDLERVPYDRGGLGRYADQEYETC
jgi:hypothetical protein